MVMTAFSMRATASGPAIEIKSDKNADLELPEMKSMALRLGHWSAATG
jgi:hypothetical protein